MYPRSLAVSLSLAAFSLFGQPAPQFVTIDVPGAAHTYAAAISNDGAILGRWQDAAGNLHAFFMANGSMTTFDCQGAVSTSPNAMNAGFQVVGTYRDAAGKWTGFLLDLANPNSWVAAGARCVALEPKGAVGRNSSTAAIGISDAGEVAGWFDDGQNQWHGYLYRAGIYMTFDLLEGSADNPRGMWPLSMSPTGELIGHMQVPGDRMRGWSLAGNKLLVLDFPPGDANGMTCSFAMNSKGEMTGHYLRTGEVVRGFHYRDGVYTSFEVPGAKRTDARGINERGDIVGFYVDANNVNHGFLLRR